jgi:hypothetical protein
MRERTARMTSGGLSALAWALAIALAKAPPSVSAQDAARVEAAPVKQITVERMSAGLRLDGRLDDDAWKQATFHSDFLQKGNDRSYPPRLRTEVAFLRADVGTLRRRAHAK